MAPCRRLLLRAVRRPRCDSAQPVQRGDRHEGQQAPGIIEQQPDGGEERGHRCAGCKSLSICVTPVTV